MKPLVSILIPAYNAEAWISDTLRCAIAQTWESKEIIVVDDGSTDRTLAIARKFESDQLRVVTHRNQGAASTRNQAYSLCRGDYIQFLDADDLMAPDKIARQMEALGSSPNKRTLLSGSWGKFMYRYYRTQFVPSALWRDLSPVEWLIRKMQLNLYMQTASWLVSRELAEAAGPWDTTLLGDDDGEYFCRVLLASDGVRFVPEAKVYYRSSGSASLSYIGNSEKKMVAQLRSMELHISYLCSLEDSQRVRDACRGNGCELGWEAAAPSTLVEVFVDCGAFRAATGEAGSGCFTAAQVVIDSELGQGPVSNRGSQIRGKFPQDLIQLAIEKRMVGSNQ